MSNEQNQNPLPGRVKSFRILNSEGVFQTETLPVVVDYEQVIVQRPQNVNTSQQSDGSDSSEQQIAFERNLKDLLLRKYTYTKMYRIDEEGSDKGKIVAQKPTSGAYTEVISVSTVDADGNPVYFDFDPDTQSFLQEEKNFEEYIKRKMFGIYDENGEYTGKTFLDGAKAIEEAYAVNNYNLTEVTIGDNKYYFPIPTSDGPHEISEAYASQLVTELDQTSFFQKMLDISHFWNTVCYEPWIGSMINGETTTVMAKKNIQSLFSSWVVAQVEQREKDI